MTDSNLTHIVFVLDRSGSMAENGKATEAEKGVRAMLDEQEAAPGKLEVTVSRFDDSFELLCQGATAAVARDAVKIEPRNMTALFDAVGKTINSVGEYLDHRQEPARPGRVVFVVATDGLENASREFNAQRLKALIDQQTSTYGWEFMFMGTSQEAVMQARSAGFAAGTSYAGSDTAAGVGSTYSVASSSLLRSRAKGAGAQTVVTDEDRERLQ